jgi:hypothetical protein
MHPAHAPRPLIQKGRKRFGKKRGSIRRWSLERSGRSQIQSDGSGRGRRKRHCRMGLRRGRRIRRGPGCRKTGPREEDTVQFTSTSRICPSTRRPARRQLTCQLCASRTGRSAMLPDHGPVIGTKVRRNSGKDMAPRWRELRGQVADRRCCLLVQTTAPGRREETPPFVDRLCSVRDPSDKVRPPCAGRMARGYWAKAETRNSVSFPPSW